ncbi:MAG: hypothetical protein RL020_1870 [Pseudomonadota bacterium]
MCRLFVRYEILHDSLYGQELVFAAQRLVQLEMHFGALPGVLAWFEWGQSHFEAQFAAILRRSLPVQHKPKPLRHNLPIFSSGASNRISTQRHELDLLEPGLDELFFRAVNYREKLLCGT